MLASYETASGSSKQVIIQAPCSPQTLGLRSWTFHPQPLWLSFCFIHYVIFLDFCQFRWTGFSFNGDVSSLEKKYLLANEDQVRITNLNSVGEEEVCSSRLGVGLACRCLGLKPRSNLPNFVSGCPGFNPTTLCKSLIMFPLSLNCFFRIIKKWSACEPAC